MSSSPISSTGCARTAPTTPTRSAHCHHTNTFRALSAGEVAAEGAYGDADLGPLHALIDVLAHAYDEKPGLERYAEPNPLTCGYQTFCGT